MLFSVLKKINFPITKTGNNKIIESSVTKLLGLHIKLLGIHTKLLGLHIQLLGLHINKNLNFVNHVT